MARLPRASRVSTRSFNTGTPQPFLNGRSVGLFIAAVVISTGCLSAAAAKKPRAAESGEGNAMVFKPNIYYPYETRRLRQTGAGVVVVNVDPATGLVTHAYMGKSTGHARLDYAATTAIRGARFQRGTQRQVKIPITFSMASGVRVEFETTSRNMDDVLAPFLGKGTVLHGPIPNYPKIGVVESQAWQGRLRVTR